MHDLEPKTKFSEETGAAVIISQTFDIPFGVAHSLVRKALLGYVVDSSFALLPGDTNNTQEPVIIAKKKGI